MGVKTEKAKRVTFIHSISFKIILLVILITLYTLLGSIIAAKNQSQRIVEESNENYILSMAELGASMIANIPEEFVSLEKYANAMKHVQIIGLDSAYAYLVGEDGTMLYHPTADKIGQSVENAVISNVVAELAAGRTPSNTVVEYDYNGAMKYAGYALTANREIVVITADKDEITEPLNSMIEYMIAIAVITLIISVGAGYIVSMFISGPIRRMTQIIVKIAALDFTRTAQDEKLCRRHDESGLMARAIDEMRNSLRDVVTDLNATSGRITTNVDGVKQATTLIHTMSTDNSATTEELAAAMEEAAAITTNVNENVQDMKQEAEGIAQMAQHGALQSGEVMERAKHMGTQTEHASNRTMQMYENVREKSQKAIEGSKAVEKINALTDTIMEISSQTSLLALNANIEAARAGEAGRGFTVVATEISNLAAQTSKAVADIDEIIKKVNEAVDNMTDCMRETTEFLEESVLADYAEFKEVSVQYQADADAYGRNMSQVKDAIEHLTALTETAADALNGIKDTVNESSIGVTDITQKTADMLTKTVETNGMVAECYDCTDELRGIVVRFKL